jgi:agmatinase
METEFEYDPNAPADSSAGIFGIPCTYEKAKLVYIPIPWEATTSYGGGTVFGPDAILSASCQLDVFDLDVKDPYKKGLHALPISDDILEMNRLAKEKAQPIKDALGEVETSADLRSKLQEVNALSTKLNQMIESETTRILKDGKIPAIIGGDHSTPMGAFQAAAKHCGSFGILHFDAHSDTRNAYMGFSDSHASIMRNAANRIPSITKFVQVGIRDFCEEEFAFTKEQGTRFEVFYDQMISERKLSGESFSKIAQDMIRNLPEQVWVSFDIDGLDPRFCPHTGTPVPGGLDYPEAVHILRALAKSGKKIIGFDVVEVAPPLTDSETPLEPVQASDEWDANVGMRLIYKLSAFALASQKIANWN